jgi:hypothetical protein
MKGEFLCLDPCIPKDWPRFEVTVRYRTARYEIRVENPSEVAQGILSATLDGAAVTQRPLRLPLLDDAWVHHIQVTLGIAVVQGAGRQGDCGNRQARCDSRAGSRDKARYTMVPIGLVSQPPPEGESSGRYDCGESAYGREEIGATEGAAKTR